MKNFLIGVLVVAVIILGYLQFKPKTDISVSPTSVTPSGQTTTLNNPTGKDYQPISDTKTNDQTSRLKVAAEAYAESHFDKTISSDKVSCASTIYGYDARFAYAWVFCGEFNSTKTLGQAYSVPTRFEFNNNYQIIASDQAADGENNPINKQLFPGKYYDLLINGHPSNSDAANLQAEATKKLSY